MVLKRWRKGAQRPSTFPARHAFWKSAVWLTDAALSEVLKSQAVNRAARAVAGSGKTGVMEIALLRLLRPQLDAEGRVLKGKRGAVKAVYIAPMRALVQEKLSDWDSR